MEALLVQHVNQQERERARFGGSTQSQTAAAGPTEVRVTLQSLLEFLEGTVPSAGRLPMQTQQKQPPTSSASERLDEGERAPPTAPASNPNPNAGLPVRGPSVRIGLGGEALARRLFIETQITLLVLNVPRQATNSLATFLQVRATFLLNVIP